MYAHDSVSHTVISVHLRPCLVHRCHLEQVYNNRVSQNVDWSTNQHYFYCILIAKRFKYLVSNLFLDIEVSLKSHNVRIHMQICTLMSMKYSPSLCHLTVIRVQDQTIYPKILQKCAV